MTKHPLQRFHVRTGADSQARASVARLVRREARKADLSRGRVEEATAEDPEDRLSFDEIIGPLQADDPSDAE
jgi:hypothetical protein